MIPLQELREKQRETGIALEVLEKDYCLGWMLKGLADSPLSGQAVLKGGTALQKLSFPDPRILCLCWIRHWRILSLCLS